MKKMTLKEIQSVNLDMMKDIHAFCVKNNIHYSLAYGSLIGAIRHKGFIPWDDDIDIWMPREDYDRFTRDYKSEKGYKKLPANDDNTYINYTIVYDDNTIVKRPCVVAKFDTGVWIDIFPIDGIPDDDSLRDRHYQLIRYYMNNVLRYRGNIGRLRGNWIDAIKAAIRLLQLRFLVKGDYRYWHRQISSICIENTYGHTKKCSSLLCGEANMKNKQEIFDTSDFLKYELKSFEDQQFMVTTEYDKVLKTIFGNYMTLPPKEKQVSHIVREWGFYWK